MHVNTIDRTEASRALAKAIAFKQVGKDTDAAEWAIRLIHLLQCAEILHDHHVGQHISA